jgi:hypothetical protein
MRRSGSVEIKLDKITYNIFILTLVVSIRKTMPNSRALSTYSCTFWADHLYSLRDEKPEYLRVLIEDGKVFKFLEKHFLY